MRASILAVCASLSATALAAPFANCTRELLKSVADSYVAAQTSGTPSFTYLSPTVAYNENDKAISITTGILSQALKLDHVRSTYDTTVCAAYTELIITDAKHPYVIGTQMRLTDGSVTKIETLVTDEGDWLFNAKGTLQYASQESWAEIPVAQRNTREVIKAAGDAYLDYFKDKSVKVPWGTPCARLEGGSYTGKGSPTDTCNVGVPNNIDLVNRRYVIDEVLGTVDIFLSFGGATTGLPDSHEFRVEGGKLRFVHTLTVMNR